MRAIVIRYLSPTNTKPGRLKVTERMLGSCIVPINTDLSAETMLLVATRQFYKTYDLEWSLPAGFATLPNSDMVGTVNQ
jgi:hypothetical protein